MAFAFRKLSFALLMPMFFVGVSAFVGQAQSQPKVPQTLFYDSDGKLISNNEFVDIRMANFHYRDETGMKVLDDGTVEFRLRKVPQEGRQVPQFSAAPLTGPRIDTDELRGKVIVLNFWFIGCGICRAIKPNLNALAAKFADNDDVKFIAITADEAAEVKKYLKKEDFNYIQITDEQSTLDKFGFSGYPKNIVISPTGEIVYWRSTISAWNKFESVIRNELGKIEK